MAKILWCHMGCLLDMTSGADLDVHQQLDQLRQRGWQVAIGGASIFNNATGYHNTLGRRTYDPDQAILKVRDSQKQMHYLVNTRHWARDRMTSAEINRLAHLFIQLLDQYKPDIFYFYGGRVANMWMATEARRRGIRVVKYVANQNYADHDLWARDVNRVVTPSHACARWYQKQIGVDMTPIGLFIDAGRVRATRPQRKHMLFVSPCSGKGGLLVAQLACRMEHSNPNITFEVVESRGQWQSLVNTVLAGCGEEPRPLNNVLVTPTQTDMRGVYERARVLLAPSLFWEPAPRVIAEAALNGIPGLITDRGGLPETAGDGGIRLTLPEAFYDPPYDKCLSDEAVTAVVGRLTRLYDDPAYYRQLSDKARMQVRQKHGLAANTDRLERVLRAALRG